MVKMQYTITSKITLTNFAANYDCNAYGAGTYNNTDCVTGANGGSVPGGLADTGYNIIIPAALGLALILAASILLIKRAARRKRHQTN
jgi:hypothetical protein